MRKLKNNTSRTRVFEIYQSVRSKNGEIRRLTKEEFINYIEYVIGLHNTYRYAYFWSRDENGSLRANRGMWESGEIYFTYEGKEYVYILDIDYRTRHHTYLLQNSLTCDKKGNLRNWKKLYKEVSGKDYEA